MFDVSAILTRVLTNGSVPEGIANSADSVFGFFSIRMAMACVRGSLLSTAIGTTAPFSAMSGAVISIALLGAEPLPPSAFTVSATLFVSNAALFHSWASTSPVFTRPATAAIASTPALPPAFNTSRRLPFIKTPENLRIRGSQSYLDPDAKATEARGSAKALFADRSSLAAVNVARATSGEDLRPQLDGVRRQVGINGVAIQVGAQLHLQPGLL